MEQCAEAFGTIEELEGNLHHVSNSSDLASIVNLRALFFDRLLSFIKPIVEYTFGVYMGFAVGWPIGLLVGNVCSEHCRPVYFSGFNEIKLWQLLPYDFARYGGIIGSILGVIVVAIINHKLLIQRVKSLYKIQVTDTKEIAQALGNSERQIQRVITNLTKKGKKLRPSLIVNIFPEIMTQHLHFHEHSAIANTNTVIRVGEKE